MNLDDMVLKARLDAERKARINAEKVKLNILALCVYVSLMVASTLLVISGRALETSGILTTEIGSYVNDIVWMGGGILLYAGWWISVRLFIRFYKRIWEWKNEQEIK